jgi:hypothetical protein
LNQLLTKTKIFQVYFKPEQLPQLDLDFTPCDNTANLQPDLQEWHVWDREYDACCADSLDYWGFFSWRFKEKMNMTGKQVNAYIADNPGYDVYLFNPCIVNEALFANSWEQGDMYHPGLSAIADKFLAKLGYTDTSVLELLLDRNRTSFATYTVGNRQFWDGYMAFSRRIFTEADIDAEFKKLVFTPGTSNYARNSSYSMFAFLNERLISTYLELTNANVLAYQHTAETLPARYNPYIKDITALSNLKVLINQYESDELYDIWDHYRARLREQHPGILGLE